MIHYVLVFDMLNYKCDRLFHNTFIRSKKYKVIIATVVC